MFELKLKFFVVFFVLVLGVRFEKDGEFWFFIVVLLLFVGFLFFFNKLIFLFIWIGLVLGFKGYVWLFFFKIFIKEFWFKVLVFVVILLESFLFEDLFNFVISLIYVFWWLEEVSFEVFLSIGRFVFFSLFDCGGVDNILKFNGLGEWVGDELVDDIIRLGFGLFVLFDECIFGFGFFVGFLYWSILLLLGLGWGRKFFW